MAKRQLYCLDREVKHRLCTHKRRGFRKGINRNKSPGGGGHSGTEWLPTAKWPCGAEAVNAKIQGRSTPLNAKSGGGQLQTKHLIRVVACKMLKTSEPPRAHNFMV